MNKVDKVKAIIKGAKSTFMSVDFVKADKTVRTITFNPKTAKGLVGDMASESSKQAVATRKANNPDLVNVCDNEILKKEDAKKAWRSFNCNSVTAIRSGGKEHVFDNRGK